MKRDNGKWSETISFNRGYKTVKLYEYCLLKTSRRMFHCYGKDLTVNATGIGDRNTIIAWLYLLNAVRFENVVYDDDITKCG